MTTKSKPKSLFERLKAGLEEGIRHLRGEIELKEYDIPAKPPAMTAAEILALRKRLALSQFAFSRQLNVSLATLVHWEAGTRKPTGAAARLLQIYGERPEILTTNGNNGSPVVKRKKKSVAGNGSSRSG